MSRLQSNVHEATGMTPFKVMFGPKPVTRINLLYPNRLEKPGEKIIRNETARVAALVECIIDENETTEQVDKLRDVEAQLPPYEVQKHIEERVSRMIANFELLGKNRARKIKRRPFSQETQREILPMSPNLTQRYGKEAKPKERKIVQGDDNSSTTSRETSLVRSSETERDEESEPEKVPLKGIFWRPMTNLIKSNEPPMQSQSKLPKSQGQNQSRKLYRNEKKKHRVKY